VLQDFLLQTSFLQSSQVIQQVQGQEKLLQEEIVAQVEAEGEEELLQEEVVPWLGTQEEQEKEDLPQEEEICLRNASESDEEALLQEEVIPWLGKQEKEQEKEELPQEEEIFLRTASESIQAEEILCAKETLNVDESDSPTAC